MTKNTDLEKLRENAEQKEKEISNKAMGNLWLPSKSDMLKENDKGELVYVDGMTQTQIKNVFMVSMIPLGLKEYDGDYGVQYHLEYIDIETGEKKRVPLHAQLHSKLQNLLNIEIEKKEYQFEFENQSEFAVTLRYCGKLSSMKENDKRKYHTWTGEKIM